MGWQNTRLPSHLWHCRFIEVQFTRASKYSYCIYALFSESKFQRGGNKYKHNIALPSHNFTIHWDCISILQKTAMSKAYHSVRKLFMYTHCPFLCTPIVDFSKRTKHVLQKYWDVICIRHSNTSFWVVQKIPFLGKGSSHYKHRPHCDVG